MVFQEASSKMRRLFFFLLPFLLMGFATPMEGGQGIWCEIESFSVPEGLTSHEPFTIEGDRDLEDTIRDEGWGGSGTEQDPYVIEDLFIDANGTSHCLGIRNTTIPLIIRNCTLLNSSFEYSNPPHGDLEIFNSSNIWINGICSQGGHIGIVLGDCSRISVSSVNLTKNGHGIRIENSDNISIRDSSISGIGTNGIVVDDSSYVMISNLTISSYYSSTGSVRIFGSNNIEMELLSLENVYNGIYIGYSWNVSGYDIDIMQVKNGLYLQNSYNIGFDFVVVEVLEGFYESTLEMREIRDSTFNDITGRNGYYFIDSYKCENVGVFNATSQGSVNGIKLYDCRDFRMEEIEIGSDYGVSVYNSDNTSFRNMRLNSDFLGFSSSCCSHLIYTGGSINSNQNYCLYISNTFNHTYSDLDLESISSESINFLNDVKKTSFENISIKGRGIRLYSYLQDLSGLERYISDSISFKEITLNDRPLFVAIDKDLGGKVFTGNFAQIILINASNGGFDNHSMESGNIDIQMAYCRDIEFNRVDQVTSSATCFYIESSTGISITDSVIQMSSSRGLDVFRSEDLTVSKCIFSNSYDSISLTATNNVTINGNFVSNGYRGIFLQGCEGVKSLNNMIYGMDHACIELVFSEMSIVNNTFIDCEIGVEIGSDSEGLITESTISDCLYSGIQYESSIKGLTVHGSEISGCGTGIRITASDHADISNTSIMECDSAIAGLDADEMNITGSFLIENEMGLSLDSSTDGYITDSLFLGNSGYGIEILDSERFTIYNNSFIHNQNDSKQCFDDSDDNRWFSHSTSRGNHWSDRTSPDSDLDGIVDVSYRLGGDETWSINPLVYSPIDLISRPRNITQYGGRDRIQLTWEHSWEVFFGDFIGYRIYRGVSEKGLVEIRSITGHTSTFTDEYVDPGVRYYYQIRAFGTAGAGAGSEIVSGIADNTAPVVEILSPENHEDFNTGNISITWIARDDESTILKYEYILDDRPYGLILSDTHLNLTDLQEGSHEIAIFATNDRGLKGVSSIRFVVDTTPPDLFFMGDLTTYSGFPEVKISWQSHDRTTGVARFSYSIDDGPWHDNGLKDSLRLSLMEGRHNLSISSTDEVGNRVERTTNIIVDMTPPEMEVNYPVPDSIINDTEVVIELEASDDLSGLWYIEYELDGRPDNRIFSGNEITLPFLHEGHHSILINAVDRCSNSFHTMLNFTVDRTFPWVRDYGPRGYERSLGEDLFIDFSEPMDRMNFRMDFPGSGTIEWLENNLIFRPSSDLEPGRSFDVSISAFDLAGNGPLILEWSFSTTNRGTVRGMVLDRDGSPVEGASVSIPDEPTVFTDEDGSFEIDAEMGHYSLKISGEGIEDLDMEVYILADSSMDLGEITASPSSENEKNDFQLMGLLVLIPLLSIIALIILLVIRKRKDSGFEFYVDDETSQNEPSEEFEEFWIDLGGEMLTDHYQVLGIPRSSSHVEIKKAYRSLASRYHPDRAMIGSDMSEAELADMMSLLNEAKEVLLDPFRRNMYDAWLYDREM